MGKLEGKTVLITGGSSGIGLATAKRFVDEGAYVFITGRRQGELETVVGQIGQNVRAVQSDVSKMADLDKLYAAVKKQKGKLDIVFANAGTGSFAPHRGAFASSRPKRPRKRFRSILASAYEFSN